MKNTYTTETVTTSRTDYHFTDRTAAGETLLVTLVKCEDSGEKNSLPAMWYKYGHTSERLATYWAVDTYAIDENGHCFGFYNPTHKNGKLDFDWVLPATEENAARLLAEIVRRASEPLPELSKETAEVGKRYAYPGGWVQLSRVYRLSEQEANERCTLYLDRWSGYDHNGRDVGGAFTDGDQLASASGWKL